MADTVPPSLVHKSVHKSGRSPGIFTCARCPAIRSALDAVPEAYHKRATVWWGAFAASAVIREQVSRTAVPLTSETGVEQSVEAVRSRSDRSAMMTSSVLGSGRPISGKEDEEALRMAGRDPRSR